MGCPWPCRCSAEAAVHCLGSSALYVLAKKKIGPLNKICSQTLFKHPLEFPFCSVACQNAFESSAAESGKLHVSTFHWIFYLWACAFSAFRFSSRPLELLWTLYGGKCLFPEILGMVEMLRTDLVSFDEEVSLELRAKAFELWKCRAIMLMEPTDFPLCVTSSKSSDLFAYHSTQLENQSKQQEPCWKPKALTAWVILGKWNKSWMRIR